MLSWSNLLSFFNDLFNKKKCAIYERDRCVLSPDGKCYVYSIGSSNSLLDLFISKKNIYTNFSMVLIQIGFPGYFKLKMVLKT